MRADDRPSPLRKTPSVMLRLRALEAPYSSMSHSIRSHPIRAAPCQAQTSQAKPRHAKACQATLSLAQHNASAASPRALARLCRVDDTHLPTRLRHRPVAYSCMSTVLVNVYETSTYFYTLSSYDLLLKSEFISETVRGRLLSRGCFLSLFTALCVMASKFKSLGGAAKNEQIVSQIKARTYNQLSTQSDYIRVTRISQSLLQSSYDP